jgi:hypothetical protein
LLGTPTDELWPGVSQFKDYKPTFPKWQPQALGLALKEFDPLGLDLLSVCDWDGMGWSE